MLDRPEEIVSRKRTERWSSEDRKWLENLPESEREHVLLLAAHLGAEPCDPRDAYAPDDPKHPDYHSTYADLSDARD